MRPTARTQPSASTSDHPTTGTPSGRDLSGRVGHASVLRALVPFIWPANRPDLRLRVGLAIGALIIAKAITACVPILYKLAVDALSGQSGAVGLPSGVIPAEAIIVAPLALIIAYGVAWFGAIGFNQLRDVLFAQVGQHAVRSLAHRMFVHLHQLPLAFHLERRTGGLSRVIDRGRGAVELIIRMGALHTVPTVIEFVLVSALLAYFLGWEFVIVMVTTVALYLVFTFKASEWRIAIRRNMNDSDTDANTKAIDSLLNYETVKYFGNEAREAERYDRAMAKYERAAVRTYTSLGMLNSGQALIFAGGLTVAMLLAARGVAAGKLTVGDFVMVNAYLMQLHRPLDFMGMIYREIKQGLVDIENMFALLNRVPDIQDKPGAGQLIVNKGEITFDNVQFAYDAARPIIKGISFTVPQGQMVAIVGPSGAGKSTISRLLFRFYELSGGHILIDGQNIADVTQASLRAAIGMVPQDTVLFNDTIRYNIRYGRPDASDDDVAVAAKLAQIDGFIATLPNGYDTMVGERGLKLSGGEKQRVAIARTILKGPPILMLDEATSALDSHTEKEIQEALDRVAASRTTLVIAHRLSTIIHADQILVLEAGQIVERGTHATLIATDGVYASMWARQREAEKAREALAGAIEAGAVPASELSAELASDRGAPSGPRLALLQPAAGPSKS